MASFTLRCRRCGEEAAYELPFFCRHCGGPLDVQMALDPAAPAALAQPHDGVWGYEALLPSPLGPARSSLGEGNTPLLRLPRLSDALGLPGLRLKNEGANPTHSFKDRFHAVAVAHALALGAAGCFCASTGNHGLAAAAYAALARLPCRVFCHPETPPELREHMEALGATVEALAPERRSAIMQQLLEAGWFPSTTSSFVPAANPFGLEGYKTIAYELIQQCDGAAPDWVLCPVGGGDGLTGVWRGFLDLAVLGVIERLPRMVACQAEGASPVVQALAAGLSEPSVLTSVSSIALSIRDATAGTHVLAAVRESHGTAVAVTDEAIVEAAAQLAGCGLLVDPASAAPVAASTRLKEQLGDDLVVCLLTATGGRWPAIREALGERRGRSSTQEGRLTNG